jgi:hypothetical protein
MSIDQLGRLKTGDKLIIINVLNEKNSKTGTIVSFLKIGLIDRTTLFLQENVYLWTYKRLMLLKDFIGEI